MYKKYFRLIAVLFTSFIAIMAHAGAGHEHDFPVGKMTSSQVLSNEGFVKSYQSFALTELDKERVLYWGKNVRIDVYFGMWCHDSEREVPRLLKVLDQQPSVVLNLIALDFNKQDPHGLAEKSGIKYTPTFIVYIDDKEVGRIVERPDVSLVEDIHQMLAR